MVFRGALGLALLSVLSLQVLADPWQPDIYGCSNQLFTQGHVYSLTSARVYQGFYQCDYLFQDPDTSTTARAYCWYFQNRTLARRPDTPVPYIDSDERCPTLLPFAGFYRIRTSEEGKCVTAMGAADGDPVELQECAADIWSNGRQIWHFQGSLFQVAGTSFDCLDVRNGDSNNGAKLQIWECIDGNANQQFSHSPGGTFVTIPGDRISWMLHPSKCLDLPAGQVEDGTPVELWDCDDQKSTQSWFLQPV